MFKLVDLLSFIPRHNERRARRERDDAIIRGAAEIVELSNDLQRKVRHRNEPLDLANDMRRRRRAARKA